MLWIRRRVLFGLVALMVTTSFGQVLQDPLPVQPVPPEKSPWGAVITIGLLTAGGVGGFFYYKKATRDRAHADSVIAVVEHAWDSASVFYEKEKYREAIKHLQHITSVWYEYDKSTTRYRRRHRVEPDSIRAVISSCDFLESMIQPIRKLSDYADNLPADEYALTKITRHDLAAQKKVLRRSLDSIYAANPNHERALRYSMQRIESRLHTVDSLVATTYIQQKTDFEIKNRFYYKQALASGDTADLRRFCENCTYYKVDKEWCERARMALDGAVADGAQSSSTHRALSVADSIHMLFDRAIGSKKIEELEGYITHFSSRRYRRYAKQLRLTEMKAALRQLQMTIDQQVAFNKKYPRINAANIHEIAITVKGLSNAAEQLYVREWKRLELDVARLPPIRLPAELVIDYTADPPVIRFEAVVDPATDITKTIINERSAYRIDCMLPVMTLLDGLKKGVIALLQKQRTSTNDSRVVEYAVKKMAYAAYTLRLNKPENGGMVLFYAKENRAAAGGNAHKTTFYEFYDIAVPGLSAQRFPVYPTSLPNIIPSLSSDSLEQKMGISFFSVP